MCWSVAHRGIHAQSRSARCPCRTRRSSGCSAGSGCRSGASSVAVVCAAVCNQQSLSARPAWVEQRRPTRRLRAGTRLRSGRLRRLVEGLVNLQRGVLPIMPLLYAFVLSLKLRFQRSSLRSCGSRSCSCSLSGSSCGGGLGGGDACRLHLGCVVAARRARGRAAVCRGRDCDAGER